MKLYVVYESYYDWYCPEHNNGSDRLASYIFDNQKDAEKFIKIARQNKVEDGRMYELEIEVIRSLMKI